MWTKGHIFRWKEGRRIPHRQYFSSNTTHGMKDFPLYKPKMKQNWNLGDEKLLGEFEGEELLIKLGSLLEKQLLSILNFIMAPLIHVIENISRSWGTESILGYFLGRTGKEHNAINIFVCSTLGGEKKPFSKAGMRIWIPLVFQFENQGNIESSFGTPIQKRCWGPRKSAANEQRC